MASPKSWYCELCNKGPFGGPKPWNEHLNSQCHKLKDILQYTAKQNPFFCDVCNVTTNSQDSLAQHLSSPRHKAAKDRAHEINCMKDNQNRRNTSDNGGSVQRTLFNRSVSCNACGEVFHDHVRAEQHFSSEAHRRNAEFEERDSVDLSSSLNPFDGSSRQTLSIIPQENLVSIHGNGHRTDTVTRQINFEQQMKQLDLDMEEEVPHLRRETENSPAEEYTFSGSRGYCYICNLELTSRPHADQHLNGKSHKKAKEKSGQAKMPPLLHNREQAIPALNKSTKEAISNRKEYIFDGSRGYCHVCETELTSQLQAEQHLQGQKHKKAVEKSTVNKAHQDFSPRTNGHGEQAIPNHNKPPSEAKISQPKEYTFDGLRGYCYVCDLELTSKAHAEQHLKGQKHRKAVERSSVNNVHRQGAPEIIGQVNQLQQQARQGIAPMNGKIQKDRSREYEWYGNRGWCNICDVELSSEQQKQQHLNGKNHEKNKKKGIYGAGGDRNLPLHCKVCDKQFSGPESAAMHYASAKHKQKAQLVGGEDYNMAVQGAEPFHLGQDRTQWVKCEVCLCLLNSEEQLEIHKRSPKHKAELDKKLRRKDQGDILFSRDQLPQTQQSANEELQLPVSHMSFKHSHIHGQRPAYPLENNSNNNSENPPPIPGTKGPQSSTDPFNLSFGLEQISQNLSQGFLINKISFGELCPEDSLNDWKQ
ncbi:hypothetical protein FSP39_020992 [Pinctada imbricata]|uniref:C2H2-type domain-containing protein n=1 Tax=Pinctada imbricata TaxID=66713 RepID=A0AA89CBD2_PINIB|nr:hypothetical protein FSP39_020992 [Pinctada imbricata]